jgi:hypothetical protein
MTFPFHTNYSRETTSIPSPYGVRACDNCGGWRLKFEAEYRPYFRRRQRIYRLENYEKSDKKVKAWLLGEARYEWNENKTFKSKSIIRKREIKDENGKIRETA